MNFWYLRLALSSILVCNSHFAQAFAPINIFKSSAQLKSSIQQQRHQPLHVVPPLYNFGMSLSGDDEEEDDEGDDDEELEEYPYTNIAASEFQDENKNSSSALTMKDANQDLDSTVVDWGGALGKLRQRVEDVESGLSKDPSHVLFRVMSSQTPNQIIGKFVQSANAQTVQAMSGAVGSLLGGLSNPTSGIETVVKASGEKIGSLCFQLQMTGYMFRNAEYVLALKDVLNLAGKASLDDYRDAFGKLDKDGSGFIEASEIDALFDNVYNGNAPPYEAEAFMKFFDQNEDGRISWDEFEKGLGAAFASSMDKAASAARLLQASYDDEDDDDDPIDVSTDVSGTIEIELENGMVVEVDAKEYMEALKDEAQSLKEELRRERGEPSGDLEAAGGGFLVPSGGGSNNSMDITGYIASRKGDVANLTEGISPEVVETMKKLVNFVLEGGDSGKANKDLSDREKAEMEMEIPGDALQQLSLWQLVLGYRLREAEAIGDYKSLLNE